MCVWGCFLPLARHEARAFTVISSLGPRYSGVAESLFLLFLSPYLGRCNMNEVIKGVSVERRVAAGANNVFTQFPRLRRPLFVSILRERIIASISRSLRRRPRLVLAVTLRRNQVILASAIDFAIFSFYICLRVHDARFPSACLRGAVYIYPASFFRCFVT